MKTEMMKSTPFPRSRAFYGIERAGQCAPSVSDDVQVTLRIHLPAAHNALVPELQFDSRCVVDGCVLASYWGTYEETTMTVARSRNFAGPSWRYAFEVADTYAVSEIEKLEIALADRARALEDAEE